MSALFYNGNDTVSRITQKNLNLHRTLVRAINNTKVAFRLFHNRDNLLNGFARAHSYRIYLRGPPRYGPPGLPGPDSISKLYIWNWPGWSHWICYGVGQSVLYGSAMQSLRIKSTTVFSCCLICSLMRMKTCFLNE